MNELNIKLSVEEVNFILQNLSELPYKTIFQLIPKIQQQANEQLNAKED